MYTDNELKELSNKAFENACELLEEAIILFEANKFARAYVLAHLSSEELAKLPIIYGTRVILHGKEQIDWRHFQKRLTNHHSKLRSIALFDYMNDEIDLIRDEDLKKYKRQIEFIKSHDAVKNIGLYSGHHEGKVYKPNEQFEYSNAEAMIHLTKGRIACLRQKWFGMIGGEISDKGYGLHKVIREVMQSFEHS